MKEKLKICMEEKCQELVHLHCQCYHHYYNLYPKGLFQ